MRGDDEIFPPTSMALEEPNGLLAAGGDLSPERLLNAYARGIFPWYQEQPVLWWSPDPRLILRPANCHVSRSLGKFLRKTAWTVWIDRDFGRVVQLCAQTREVDTGTWITHDMRRAYLALHRMGYAHSVEVYDAEQLVGGLYGVSLGNTFFGESMFSLASNASKMALVYLARFLSHNGFRLIDCQVTSSHLQSLGAEEVSRQTFERELNAGLDPEVVKSAQLTWQKAHNKGVSVDGRIQNQIVQHP